MAGLNVIGLFAPDWLANCGKEGQLTCEEAAKIYKEAQEEAAKKVAPAFTGTPTTTPSTTTAIFNAASRFKDCDVEVRGPGGHTTCR